MQGPRQEAKRKNAARQDFLAAQLGISYRRFEVVWQVVLAFWGWPGRLPSQISCRSVSLGVRRLSGTCECPWTTLSSRASTATLESAVRIGSPMTRILGHGFLDLGFGFHGLLSLGFGFHGFLARESQIHIYLLTAQFSRAEARGPSGPAESGPASSKLHDLPVGCLYNICGQPFTTA